MIGLLSGAASLATGGNVTRMAYTLAIGLALGGVGAWRVQSWRYDANTAALRVSQADAQASQARAAIRAQEQAQVAVDELRKAQNAQTENDRRRITALTASLRNRAERPADTVSLASTGGRCTGTGLYRDDAEFLGWYAGEAARISAAFERCQAQYRRVENALKIK